MANLTFALLARAGLFGFGLILLFIGERFLGAGGSRTLFSGAGAALMVLSFVLRFVNRGKARPGARQVEGYLLALYALAAFALLLYVMQSDLWVSLTGSSLEKTWPKLATVLGALWPAVLAASILPIIFGEMAYSSVAHAPTVEALRVRDAILSGLGLAGALVFSFSIYYVASERDHKVDFSYFRTAKAGESTQKIVEQLDQPLIISLFFPPANEVREEVLEYFKDLKSKSKFLEVNVYDHAVDPLKAKELAVTGNGIVVVSRAARKEPLSIGLDLEGARNQLRNLDKEIQKRMLQVARPQRTVYLTTGHGERSPFPSSDTDKRRTIRDVKELLTQQGYQVKDLGMAEGLGVDVPNDAAIVLAIGPQKPFVPEEIAAIGRYFDRGGRVFVALDPENGDMADLLKTFNLAYSPVTLANDQFYGRITNRDSDRANLATGSYSSHPSVSTLGRLGQRAPMVLLGAGSLSELKAVAGVPKTMTVDFPVRAHPATWNDLNGNFTFDSPAETRKGWEIGASVVKKTNAQKPDTDGRALVLGDSDAMSDGIIASQPGNAYYVLDGMKWLLGDEAIAGEVSSEVDVPIIHTKKQDQAWFFSTILIGPLLVIGLGWLANRRRVKQPKSQSKSSKKESK